MEYTPEQAVDIVRIMNAYLGLAKAESLFANKVVRTRFDRTSVAKQLVGAIRHYRETVPKDIRSESDFNDDYLDGLEKQCASNLPQSSRLTT